MPSGFLSAATSAHGIFLPCQIRSSGPSTVRRGGEVLPEFARFLLGKRLKISAYVFTPFKFEGINAMRSAENCIAELTELGIETHIYPNQDTFAEVDEGTTFAEAFALQSKRVFSMISDW